MKPIHDDISVELVNHELTKLNSPDLLTRLRIEELELTAFAEKQLQNRTDLIGRYHPSSFQKYLIHFQTESSCQEDEKWLFLYERKDITAKRVAQAIFDELSGTPVPDQKQEPGREKNYLPQAHTLLPSLAILLADMGICLLKATARESGVFFTYADLIAYSTMVATVVFIYLFFSSPAFHRLRYLYALLAICLSWLGGMGMSLLHQLG
ncbi:hypothetical protein [Spirosoma sp. KNUC1025]|uniref:hypothetical protein n=1 Tax=Spirosoma sp. KNUC1025 TaxID=2894082 RepID=UPI00386CE33E|nr:hypothetical protein LN737_00545 [Spirosoma sp. KNUC1025]